MDDSKQRRVLVTGGTGSIGSEIVRLFSKLGYETTFQFYERSDRASALSEECGAAAVQMNFLDIAPDPRLENFDVIVNCAGVNYSSNLAHEMEVEDWNAMLMINLSAPFILIRNALPRMMSRRWGRIVNVGSIFSKVGSLRNSAYNSSKHGLSGLTKSIAREYGRFGITCNEVLPGPVESDMLTRVAATKAEQLGTTPSAYFEGLVNAIPTGRLAACADIAAAVVFLASENSGHINGTAIIVDGGSIC